ncbi:hypothetical protein [Microbacterium terricola]|uniref:Uncharacterized protein n=1 Tax=Microbacterium terricola TaxID=344163 RepID=A0ABM8DUS2_9MICO|nr:hypothetical protein [Microbacterium terricola]UYK39858.1 hypothetical protein OAU46_14355 [Microbacterium terricola]BDV29388.1 hypothetical protein Microterr_00480 [Microbacterium terricola]
MAEAWPVVLAWVVPALVVFASAAVAITLIVWGIRQARRGRKARGRAEAARTEAGAALVRLDDAVEELDIEVGLSGALHDGTAPPALRRARLTAQHVRDDGFERFRAISEEGVHPAQVRDGARHIQAKAIEALAAVTRAQAEHGTWVRAHITAGEQVAAARRRLAAARESLGDPAALVAELSQRFADDEWRGAARAAHGAVTAAASAQEHLDRAAELAADPAANALPELAAGERALRQVEAEARALEESHRLVLQAAQALPDEFSAARAAHAQATALLPGLAPAAAERLTAELRGVDARLAELEPDAERRPTRTVDAIARLRGSLDLAVGDARTAQQRLRGARTALPGTLAAARHTIAEAEASVSDGGADADARARLASAQRELAAARQGQDPVAALDAARRAIRDAEDAKALGDYARLAGP